MRSEAWLRLMSGFVLVGVFAAGALFGAGLLRWVAPHDAPHERRPPEPPGPIEAMTHELDLDASQRDQLRAIMDAHGPELDAILRETQPRIRRVLEAIEADMVPHLRADQVKKLEEWRKRRPPPPMPGMGPPPPPPGGLP